MNSTGLPRKLCALQRDDTGCSTLQSCYISHKTISAREYELTGFLYQKTGQELHCRGNMNEYLPYVQIILLASLKRRIPFGDDTSKFKRCDLKNNSKNIQMVIEAENCNGFIPKTKKNIGRLQSTII